MSTGTAAATRSGLRRWPSNDLSQCAKKNGMRKPAKILFVGLFLSPLLVVPPLGKRVVSRIDCHVFPEDAISKVDPRFISYALDIGMVVKAPIFFTSSTRYDGVDFSSPVLRRLAKTLAPAVLRIGGTYSDSLYFAEDDEGMPAGYKHKITGTDLRNMHDFAEAADADILFTLNMVLGPIQKDRTYDPTNQLKLVNYCLDNNLHRFKFWEAGNETNSYLFMFFPQSPWSAKRYARMARRLKEGLGGMLGEKHLFVGPSSLFHSYGEFPWPFTPNSYKAAMRECGSEFDIVTWHHYATQSRRFPLVFNLATVDSFLSLETSRRAGELARYVEKHAGDSPIWNSEFSSAVCGGEPGLSDTFADTLLSVGLLKALAENGTEVAVRQSLVGADYGLLEDKTFRPNPSYFLYRLWNERMYPVYVRTSSSWEDSLRIAGTKSEDGSTITLVLANVEGYPIRVDGYLHNSPRPGPFSATTLSAAGPTAKQVFLNGRPIGDDTSNLDFASGEKLEGRGNGFSLCVPAYSIVFIGAELGER